jgi:hypothetical protein
MKATLQTRIHREKRGATTRCNIVIYPNRVSDSNDDCFGCAVTEAELPGIIEQMEARLQRRRLQPHAEEVWSATYILLGLRYSRELARQLLRGTRSMKESVTYQAILEEGEEKGALAEARKFLLRMGRSRFGPPNAPVTAAVERIADVERLEELGERLLSAATWEELLGLPVPRRPRSRRRPRA